MIYLLIAILLLPSCDDNNTDIDNVCRIDYYCNGELIKNKFKNPLTLKKDSTYEFVIDPDTCKIEQVLEDGKDIYYDNFLRMKVPE